VPAAAIVRVAAAVLLRPDGQVLLAQRPAGKPYAGYWEFPGGKLEPGETPRHALDRELDEELGIIVRRATPWLVQEFVYPHAHVELNFFRVFEWEGELASRDQDLKLRYLPGFVEGKQEPFNGRLDGVTMSYEFVRTGKPMLGRTYYLQVDNRTIYALRFTGLRDKLSRIRNQTDLIARTFKLK